MHLLLIRHASAVARGTPGIQEADRPLTAEGARRFRKASKGLARILARPDVLLSSPLPRARQTAEIVAQAFGALAPIDAPELVDGRFESVMRLVSTQRGAELVALVGHEPWLSASLARLVGADDAGGFALRKGGAALLELGGTARAGATLIWLMPPRVLRQLA